MDQTSVPVWIGSERRTLNGDLAVFDKADGTLIARTGLATPALISEAIDLAVAAAPKMAAFPAHARARALRAIAAAAERDRDALARLLCAEAGKPIRDARGEVRRMIDTFAIAAGEAERLHGEAPRMDTTPRGAGWFGLWQRVPIGPCSLIAPFNFPLNLAAHKIAPAIAAGCPFILKPASFTPLATLKLGEILASAGLPAGSWSILPCTREDADALTTDERLKLLSFTGSPDVGWALKRKAGRKKVILELGGNAACIVHEDADLDDAARRIVFSAFFQAGQSCISTQRILIHRPIYERLRDLLLTHTRALIVGDPREETTFVGPLISEADARRVEQSIAAAVSAGASILTGGERRGAWISPTLLEAVPSDAAVSCREIFGPVATLEAYDRFEDALARTNASAYGLQAGLFTKDYDRILQAFDVLEVGGLIVGEAPSFRLDALPYGGVKESGLGREGPRFAIEDMTEIRLLAIRRTT